MRRLPALLALPLLVLSLVACGGDDDAGSASAGTGGASSGSVFCRKARALDAKYQDLGAGGPNGLPKPGAIEAAADEIDKLVGDAPARLKADLKTMSGSLRKAGEVLGSFDLSDPKAMADPANAQKLEQLQGEMQTAQDDMQAASGRVARYLSDECGIDVGDTSTTAG